MFRLPWQRAKNPLKNDSDPSRLWRQFWSAQAETAAGETLTFRNIPNLAPRVEALLQRRLQTLVLPPDIMALYKERSARATRKMMQSWCAWVAWLNMIPMALDYLIVPHGMFAAIFLVRTMITLMFLTASQTLRRGGLVGAEHLAIIFPCLLTIIAVGIIWAGKPEEMLLVFYALMAMVTIATGVLFLRMDFAHTKFLAGSSVILMILCLAAGPAHDIGQRLEAGIFCAGLMISSANARRVQNLYQYRLFLLKTRDELRRNAVVRRNEQLSSLAYTDKLTDLPNRRYFDEICASITEDTKNLLPLSLCLIDIDHFKTLNDRLGHLRGDRCLRIVATAIRNNLRGRSDILARYGGEEFVLLLSGTGLEAALDIAERIRQAIADLRHPNPGAPSQIVTISLGVAVATARPVLIEPLLGSADRALYRAKQAGRNRVMFERQI
jgi:diguanylate cyclase (GGDEF)-like protein